MNECFKFHSYLIRTILKKGEKYEQHRDLLNDLYQNLKYTCITENAAKYKNFEIPSISFCGIWATKFCHTQTFCKNG